jgi:hypothetical protein
MLEQYDLDLETAGESRLVSSGTPLKTGEPGAALAGRNDIVHMAGVCG